MFQNLLIELNYSIDLPIHSGGGELHSPSGSLSPSSLQVVFVKLLLDNAYPSLQEYVQKLPIWVEFVHETLPLVGAVLGGVHVMAIRKVVATINKLEKLNY